MISVICSKEKKKEPSIQHHNKAEDIFKFAQHILEYNL